MSITRAALNAVMTAAAGALVAVGASTPLVAQPTQNTTVARVYSIYPNDICRQDMAVDGAAVSSVSCGTTSPGIASGSASATANNATRTASASGTISSTGLQGSGTPTGTAAGTTGSRSITYSGSDVPTNLVFEYAVSHAEGATGGAFVAGESEMFIYDAINNPAIVWTRHSTEDGESVNMAPGVSADGPWVDGNGTVTFTIPYTGDSPYVFSTYVQGDSYVNNYQHDAGTSSGFGTISATLTRVYATNGSWTSSDALFDDDGNAVIQAGQADTTPEPSSIALLASGLVGLIPVARRSRKNG